MTNKVAVITGSTRGIGRAVAQAYAGEGATVACCGRKQSDLDARRVARLMMLARQGSIINVSSAVGRVGRAAWGAYSVSKFGLEGLTQILAAELRDFDVRVNALNPGGTRTSMRAQAYPEEDPLTLPQPLDIVDGFVHLAADESRHVTGRSLDARDWPWNSTAS